MEIISQKVGTSITTMSIKDTKETAFGPILNFFLSWWLHNVEYNTNSIFIIISYYTLVSIGSIPHNNSIFSYTTLRWLPSR